MEKYKSLIKPEFQKYYPTGLSKLHVLSGSAKVAKIPTVESKFHQGEVMATNSYKPCAIIFKDFE